MADNKYRPSYIQNRGSLLDVQYQRARIQNLRNQSPFDKGKRNQDFINPSLTSNLVFYNYGRERITNPHLKTDIHARTKGYNLDNYVITEPEYMKKEKTLPVGQNGPRSKYSIKGVQRSQRDLEKTQKVSKIIRSSQRSVSRVRKSKSRSNLSNLKRSQRSANIRSQRSMINTSKRSINGKKSIVRSQRSITRRRSVNSKISKNRSKISDDRYSQKSQLSIREQAQQRYLQKKGVLVKGGQMEDLNFINQGIENQRRNIENNQRDQYQQDSKIKSELQSQQEQSSKREKFSQKSEHYHHEKRSSKKSSKMSSHYDRVSGSNVSHPENLVCDLCLNRRMHNDKLEELRR